MDKIKDFTSKYRFDVVIASIKDLFDLINGEEVTLPHFNFQTGLRETGKTIRVDENSPIIIEGIHALENANFNNVAAGAVRAAYKRTLELKK